MCLQMYSFCLRVMTCEHSSAADIQQSVDSFGICVMALVCLRQVLMKCLFLETLHLNVVVTDLQVDRCICSCQAALACKHTEHKSQLYLFKSGDQKW
jgi:hypothetical protein